MKLNCPDLKCPSRFDSDLIPGSIVGYGSYYRSSDSKRIKRFRCKLCGRHFSRATLNDCYYQKKRRINFQLYRLLCSGVSQRRSAMLLRVNRKTVERRFRFLASQARARHEVFLNSYRDSKLFQIHFDDLETSEHSKCKPLSVALAVEPHFRKIMGFEVSRMPAKGHLAKISIQRYGHRPDDRSQGWDSLIMKLKETVSADGIFSSDENPHYPKVLKRHFPQALHLPYAGARGSITGSGELKKIRFDPLFALNHSCAMLRANLNRLFRRTWCTTKTLRGLTDHLSIYVDFHNRFLTQKFTRQSTGLGAS